MMVQRKDVIEKIKAWGASPARRDGVFLVLDEIQRESKTPAGLIVLDQTTIQQDTRQATVVGVGKDVRGVRVDDRVVIGKYYGVEVPHGDSRACKMVLVSEDQIDALIE